MKVTVHPSKAEGAVPAPPSKSCAHRLLLGSALAVGGGCVRNVSYSEDILATLDCISSLGIPFDTKNDSVVFRGIGQNSIKNAVFPCRESGSTLRFMIPAALALTNDPIFKCSHRLIERGIDGYEEIFRDKGITVRKESDSFSFSGRLTPGKYEISGETSSQYATGLMFALPLLDGDSALRITPPVTSRSYIDITLEVLRKFGISIIEPVRNTFYIPGHQGYRTCDNTVEGDWSNAAALFALSSVGGNVSVTGLKEDSAQGDRKCLDLLKALDFPDAIIDLTDCPDLAPVLFAVAALRHGARFTGTKRLKFKESDRVSAMAEELQKFGIRLNREEDSVTVYGGTVHAPSEVLSSHNDHRIVMALTVLSSVTGGVIDGAETIRKSYPDFFEAVSSLGLKLDCED